MIIAISGCFSCSKVRSNSRIKTWKEMKEQNVVMQRFDFSCGIGSLATLMKYYFQDNVTEDVLIKEFFDFLPKDTKVDRQENGLSLLDLKRISEHRGYKAYGVTLKLSSLYKIDRPILIYLETDEFKHFSVFRGIWEDRIFLADPSWGNIKVSMDRFLKEWKGKMALVLDKEDFVALHSHGLSMKEWKDEFFGFELWSVRNSLSLHY